MKCKVCGRNSESDYCFQHKLNKNLSSINSNWEKPALTINKKVSAGKSSQNKDHLFFEKIWKKRPHRSEISGKYLGKTASSGYFHHILPKSKYPEIRMDEENIILLTLDEHANVESDMYKYEKINQIREKLKTKYNII